MLYFLSHLSANLREIESDQRDPIEGILRNIFEDFKCDSHESSFLTIFDDRSKSKLRGCKKGAVHLSDNVEESAIWGLVRFDASLNIFSFINVDCE